MDGIWAPRRHGDHLEYFSSKGSKLVSFIKNQHSAASQPWLIGNNENTDNVKARIISQTKLSNHTVSTIPSSQCEISISRDNTDRTSSSSSSNSHVNGDTLGTEMQVPLCPTTPSEVPATELLPSSLPSSAILNCEQILNRSNSNLMKDSRKISGSSGTPGKEEGIGLDDSSDGTAIASDDQDYDAGDTETTNMLRHPHRDYSRISMPQR